VSRRIHNPMSRWPWLRGRPPGPERALPAVVWLAFVVFPVVDALTNHGAPAEHWLAVWAALMFVATYIGLLLLLWGPHDDPRRVALLGVLAVIAIVLTVADHRGWGFLFTYVAACVAVSVPSRVAFTAVVATTALAVGCSLLGGASAGTAIGYGASTIGVGLLMVLLGDLRMRNRELSEARAELARVAIVHERERFARDLHDLLGHSLSVIAIKAELAGRLLPNRPADAASEVADVEQVARQALREVRQAVSGYRRPTLEGELEGARMALSAAGIDAAFERAPVTLDPEIEAVLAWAVREGATNVIRHSGARHCRVRVRADEADAGVEVVDDGAGAGATDAASNGDAGNGIAGLRERAERLRGRIEAGCVADGSGFRLAVSVPTTGDRP